MEIIIQRLSRKEISLSYSIKLVLHRSLLLSFLLHYSSFILSHTWSKEDCPLHRAENCPSTNHCPQQDYSDREYCPKDFEEQARELCCYCRRRYSVDTQR